jgi:hypothetical protein
MDMERTLWTDERIDDAMDRIEKRFEAIERRLDRIEDELVAIRRDMHNMMLAMMTGYLGLAGLILGTSL